MVSDHFARTSRCPPLKPVLPHCDLRYLTRFCELTDESVAVGFLVDMKFSFAALPALREPQAFLLLFLIVRARCDVLLCKLPLWFQRRLKRRGCAGTSCHYSRKGPFWAMCGPSRAVRIAALGNGQRMKQSSKSARLGSARAAACCRVRQLQTRHARAVPLAPEPALPHHVIAAVDVRSGEIVFDALVHGSNMVQRPRLRYTLALCALMKVCCLVC